ncbi:hypothetical protein RND81_11G013400 [Saponaria officinalis]|uniref:Uncharacterized protein n=1 Tax=Saponaria officinalis TaxID=3572 RepID=A0AAW1HG27_SAPOF
MATVLGNLALPVDLTSPAKLTSDHRKIIRLIPFDVVLSLSLSRREKDFPACGVELSEGGGGDHRSFAGERGGVKAKFAKKTNAVEFDASSSDEDNGNGNGDEEEEFDWETEMRRRVTEIEEMRELEKKAEEVTGKVYGEERESGGGDGGGEESEEEKKMRVRKELEKVAKEQAERRATAKLMFELGQKAYGRGMYGRAIEFLEAALTIIPKATLYGGEIQIWLAMAYAANGRHADCVALYRQLELKHPCVSIRRQAADLRYIMQAPKIKITQEEMVTIPLIGSSYDSYASTWTDKEKDRSQVIGGSTTRQLPSSRDYLGDVLKWKTPDGWENNRVFWAAVTLWFGLVGVALLLQR